MWKKVSILLMMVTLSLAYPNPNPNPTAEDAAAEFPLSSSTEEVVEEDSAGTTTMRTMMMTSGEESLSGNYSDSVVVETVVADEEESGSEADEAKEFDPNDCFLEKERGPCRAVIDSWFYNKETRSCESFMWSGCGGNNNRFSEDKKCQQACNNVTLVDTTTQPEQTSSSSASSSSSTSSSPAPVAVVPSPKMKKTATCPKFEGCSTKGCIVVQEASTNGCKVCQCVSDSDVGTVKITRSAGTLSSEVVNKNPVIGSVSGQPSSARTKVVVATNSSSSEAADDESKEVSTEKPEDVCQLPEVRGNCRAMMTRYRWDGTKCVLFHFGGCDGNGNNFVTEKKCMDVCKPK